METTRLINQPIRRDDLSMKLISIESRGLKIQLPKRLDLHPDLNLLTGINGSGKTTLLKLLWYLISGNCERIPYEISLEYVKLVTSLYTVTIEKVDNEWRWAFRSATSEDHKDGSEDSELPWGPQSSFETLNRLVVTNASSSLFFPTFRRIEGGYSTMRPKAARRRRTPFGDLAEWGSGSDIGKSLQDHAEKMSVRNHRFICAISTTDIDSLIISRYAAMSEKLTAKYTTFTEDILNQVRQRTIAGNAGNDNSPQAQHAFAEIKRLADEINRLRIEALRPFQSLAEVATQMLGRPGIAVSDSSGSAIVDLGDSVEAINSTELSAGEKQVLGFLCWNTFTSGAVIFIDEPELSLHPDWQRRLLPILLEQQPDNQIVAATHSPFIYAKYPDKEIRIREERGE